MADATSLPTPERRAFIVSGLESLRAARGDVSFLRGRIFEAGDRDFPDRWEPTAEGARRLALRVLAHAGLGDLGADMVGYRHDRPKTDSLIATSATNTWHAGTAAWFAGIDPVSGVCSFGIDLDGLGDAASVVGTICHEVAHAYRHVHDLWIDDRELDEEMTDLTTVFLGFGLLTTNAAYVYRSGGVEGTVFRGVEWSHSQRGYLTVAEMAYALAYQVQLREREGERGLARRVAAGLAPTQRACFDAALEERGVRRRLLPTWAPYALIAIVPLAAGAWLFVDLVLHAPARCGHDRECREGRHGRCERGRCEYLCATDADCDESESCVRHACE